MFKYEGQKGQMTSRERGLCLCEVGNGKVGILCAKRSGEQSSIPEPEGKLKCHREARPVKASGPEYHSRSCFPMHTQGPAQVDTFSFQLLTFRWDPKDLEVLKANGSDCSRGFGQERHHNDILGLTASDVGHPAVPKSPTWAKVKSLTY